MHIFKAEITFLAHQVSKEGVQPSNSNLKGIVECMLPQMYTEMHAFLGLVDHYRCFIKGFAHIAQPLNEHLAQEGASRKSEWVLFSEDALKAFKALKHACMTAPVLVFAYYTKQFQFGDQCVQEWTWGSAIVEAGRQTIPPSHIWQQNPYTSWEEPSLN